MNQFTQICEPDQIMFRVPIIQKLYNLVRHQFQRKQEQYRLLTLLLCCYHFQINYSFSTYTQNINNNMSAKSPFLNMHGPKRDKNGADNLHCSFMRNTFTSQLKNAADKSRSSIINFAPRNHKNKSEALSSVKSDGFNKRFIELTKKFRNILKSSNHNNFQIMVSAEMTGRNVEVASYDESTSTLFIVLKRDTNCDGYSRQMYFQIETNSYEVPQTGVTITVMNVNKNIKDSPLKVVHVREGEADSSVNDGWREGPKFVYEEGSDAEDHFIRFQAKFLQKNCRIEVCLYLPYTLNRFKQFLANFKSLKEEQIGKTIKGNSIICLKSKQQSTASTVFAFPRSENQSHSRKKVLIIARQHPCENVSSFICEYLLKNLSQSAFLLSSFSWHIIPIANPDGVQFSNSRFNYGGYDMNRCWAPHLFGNSTESKAISVYLKKIGLNQNDIIIDLHGHSRELDCFTYCTEFNEFNHQFNKLMNEKCPSFKQSKCQFGIHESKSNCFRSYVKRYFKVRNCITFQTSLTGYEREKQRKNFTIQDFDIISQAILESLTNVVRHQEGEEKMELKTKKKEREKKEIAQRCLRRSLNEKDLKQEKQKVRVTTVKLKTETQKGIKQFEKISETVKEQKMETPKNFYNFICNEKLYKERRSLKNIIKYAQKRQYQTQVEEKMSKTNRNYYFSEKKDKTQKKSENQISLALNKQTINLPAWASLEYINNLKLNEIKSAIRRRNNFPNNHQKHKKELVERKKQKIEVSMQRIIKLID